MFYEKVDWDGSRDYPYRPRGSIVLRNRVSLFLLFIDPFMFSLFAYVIDMGAKRVPVVKYYSHVFFSF